MHSSLSSFIDSVNRVRDIAAEIDKNVKAALSDVKVLRRHETMQCAVTVVLSGYFESFLVEIAEAFVDALCAKSIPFDNLPLRIRATHFRGGAEYLAKEARRESKSLGQPRQAGSASSRLTESATIAQRIASVAVALPYELISEAFGDTRANPGPQSLREFLNRFDVKGAWRKLADETGWSETTIDAWLKSFVLIRNECAHSGTGTPAPSTNDIRGYCELLETLASGISAILNAHLASPAFQ
jgi:RiboL-PSP-HEPN